MTREQLRQKALRLRKQGKTYSEIAAALGGHASTVYRYLNPDYEERQRAKAREWKSRHPEEVRAYDRAYQADPTTRAKCEQCGGPVQCSKGDARAYRVCATCIHRAVEERDRELERLWAEGAKFPDLMEHFGWTKGTLGRQMFLARRRGANLPYRYSMQDGKRVAA